MRRGSTDGAGGGTSGSASSQKRSRSRGPRAASRAELARLTEELVWRRPPGEAPIAPPSVTLRKLTIAMIGWEFPPQHTGGLGVHCYELCKELTRMGHRVVFLTPFNGPFTRVDGVTFRWPGSTEGEAKTASAPIWAYSGPLELAQMGASFEGTVDGYNRWIASLSDLPSVDLVHVHDWFGTMGGLELARRLGVPMVMTIHSTEYNRSLDHPWQSILDRERVGLRNADRVIAVSRHLKQEVIDRYGARPDRVRVIYNAVRPTGRLQRLHRAGKIVLYLGRLAAMKGVDTFLRAAARVAPIASDALFVIAGEGPEYPNLVRISAHLGISDRVLFLGRVTDDERSVLLASASVFVLPSVVEPFGIAALEAMVAGVPTIVSKTSGVAEISQGTFAVDFWDIDEFASRIAELLEYPVLSRAMGDRARWEALRAGWPERAMETVGVYVELVGPPRADGAAP